MCGGCRWLPWLFLVISYYQASLVAVLVALLDRRWFSVSPVTSSASRTSSYRQAPPVVLGLAGDQLGISVSISRHLCSLRSPVILISALSISFDLTGDHLGPSSALLGLDPAIPEPPVTISANSFEPTSVRLVSAPSRSRHHQAMVDLGQVLLLAIFFFFFVYPRK